MTRLVGLCDKKVNDANTTKLYGSVVDVMVQLVQESQADTGPKAMGNRQGNGRIKPRLGNKSNHSGWVRLSLRNMKHEERCNDYDLGYYG